jgi:hypothetical protein
MPYEDAIRVLRDGKAVLRQMRQRASIEEKLLDLWRGQHVYVQIVGGRRPLRPWERPWNIRSDVRDTVVLRDGAIVRETLPFSGSSSQLVRPRQPWILNSERP